VENTYSPDLDEVTTMPDNFAQIIATMQENIDAVDDEIIMGVVGVAQALDELRKALKEVDASLDSRNFEDAAALGYRSVSSGYIFLQRTLGGLQSAVHRKQSLVSEVAMKAACAYEDALPHVDAVMKSAQPKN
jgi:hypothetical protein